MLLTIFLHLEGIDRYLYSLVYSLNYIMCITYGSGGCRSRLLLWKIFTHFIYNNGSSKSSSIKTIQAVHVRRLSFFALFPT